MRQARGQTPPDRPEWCWLPPAGVYAIVEGAARTHGLKIPPVGDVGNLGAVLARRWSRRAHLATPEACAAVADAEPDIDFSPALPSALPGPCVWIVTPDLPDPVAQSVGFFAFGEYDVNRQRPELRIVPPAPGREPFGDQRWELVSVPIHLGYRGVDEGLTAMLENRLENNNKESVKTLCDVGEDQSLTTNVARRLAAWLASASRFRPDSAPATSLRNPSTTRRRRTDSAHNPQPNGDDRRDAYFKF